MADDDRLSKERQGGAEPGAVRVRPGTIRLNADRSDDERLRLVIVNTGDRPIQIGSHLHLPDANTALAFDREAAQGFRLDIPSGTSQRFEPGASREVARSRSAAGGECLESSSSRLEHPMRWIVVEISRAAYAALYGPTVGDQVRLGDTDLWVEVEQDLTVGGEEVVFGGGKSIRESMAQGTTTRARGCARHHHHQRAGRRLVGHRPRRRGHPGRPDRRPRPRGQSGHRGRRTSRPPDRAIHRRDRRRGSDPHRRRDRLARPPAVAVAASRGARDRDHHDRRRRHRPERGLEGDHGHARRVAPRADASRARRRTAQHPAARQGEHRQRRGPRRTGARRRRRVQAARGLGFDAGRDRHRAARRGRLGSPGRAARRQPERGRVRRVDARRDRGPGRSTRSTSRARAAVTRRTSSRSRRTRTSSRARRTRRCRTPSTPSPSTSTC